MSGCCCTNALLLSSRLTIRKYAHNGLKPQLILITGKVTIILPHCKDNTIFYLRIYCILGN